jgi:hypothetical protein
MYMYLGANSVVFIEVTSFQALPFFRNSKQRAQMLAALQGQT